MADWGTDMTTSYSSTLGVQGFEASKAHSCREQVRASGVLLQGQHKELSQEFGICALISSRLPPEAGPGELPTQPYTPTHWISRHRTCRQPRKPNIWVLAWSGQGPQVTVTNQEGNSKREPLNHCFAASLPCPGLPASDSRSS